jgi:hypothetical protein
MRLEEREWGWRVRSVRREEVWTMPVVKRGGGVVARERGAQAKKRAAVRARGRVDMAGFPPSLDMNVLDMGLYGMSSEG